VFSGGARTLSPGIWCQWGPPDLFDEDMSRATGFGCLLQDLSDYQWREFRERVPLLCAVACAHLSLSVLVRAPPPPHTCVLCHPVLPFGPFYGPESVYELSPGHSNRSRRFPTAPRVTS
jgi:hypothetical protein